MRRRSEKTEADERQERIIGDYSWVDEIRGWVGDWEHADGASGIVWIRVDER